MRFLGKISLYAKFGQKWGETCRNTQFLHIKWGNICNFWAKTGRKWSIVPFLGQCDGKILIYMQKPSKAKERPALN
jgi:hypothetical protein